MTTQFATDKELMGMDRSPSGGSLIVTAMGLATVLVAAGFSAATSRLLIFIAGLVVLIVTGWLTWLVARSRRLKDHLGYLMMLFGLVYWFAIPALVTATNTSQYLGEKYGIHVTPRAAAWTSMYLVLYLALAVWSYWLTRPGLVATFQDRTVPLVTSWFYLGVLGLFLAGLVPYIVHGGGIKHVMHELLLGRSGQQPWKAEGALGDHRSALYYVCISGFVAAAGLAGSWAIFTPGSLFRRTFLAIFAIGGTIVLLDGGTRSWVALAWLPTLLVWIATTMKTRVNLERIAGILVLICAFQLLFEVARASRNHGWSLDRVRSMDFRERHFDNDFFTDAAVAVELVPRRHPYFGIGDIVAFAAHPVPRFLWKNKPVPPILIYYNEVVHHGLLKKKGNKLPSHIGQAHMSFGPLGVVLLGVAAGLIAGVSSALLGSSDIGKSHLGSLLAVWWFLMGRGIYPGWTYPLIFAWILLTFGFRQVLARPPLPDGVPRRVQAPPALRPI